MIRAAWIKDIASSLFHPVAVEAQSSAGPLHISAADTAFMISATGLVLLMTIPGLALFYAGMVRKRNVLATMAQSVASVCIVSILWMVAGYSLSFAGGDAVLGSLSRAFLSGIGLDDVSAFAPTIPELLFAAYQMTFAVIACALVAGSVADRMTFSAFCLFCSVWLFIVYVPSAHWVWGGGFLAQAGLIDFAGGTVVHINAGVAGLVAALVIGPRQGFGRENLSPFDLSLAVIGVGLLWVGWFGFNGGSAYMAGSRAVFAIMSTHLAACAGACVWTAFEWRERGKPSVLGVISGAVAGLGAITPASGFILPWHGLVIGALSGLLCYWCCTVLKHRLKYDDSLDVFGVHGVGGIIGTLMAGVFATSWVSAAPDAPGASGLLEGNVALIKAQALGVVVTIAWAAVGTWITLRIVGVFANLRVSADDEREGLDLSLHGEALHHQ